MILVLLIVSDIPQVCLLLGTRFGVDSIGISATACKLQISAASDAISDVFSDVLSDVLSDARHYSVTVRNGESQLAQ